MAWSSKEAHSILSFFACDKFVIPEPGVCRISFAFGPVIFLPHRHDYYFQISDSVAVWV
jgi:hypothetical protein